MKKYIFKHFKKYLKGTLKQGECIVSIVKPNSFQGPKVGPGPRTALPLQNLKFLAAPTPPTQIVALPGFTEIFQTQHATKTFLF